MTLSQPPQPVPAPLGGPPPPRLPGLAAGDKVVTDPVKAGIQLKSGK